MTKLLEKAVEIVRTLPSVDQDEIAQAMLQLAVDGHVPEQVAPADLQAVLQGLTEIRRGEFASDADIAAALRRFDS